MMLERFKPLKVKPIADSNYQLMKHSNLWELTKKVHKMLKEFEHLKVKHIADYNYKFMMPSNLWELTKNASNNVI
jgi:hypothetical protein